MQDTDHTMIYDHMMCILEKIVHIIKKYFTALLSFHYKIDNLQSIKSAKMSMLIVYFWVII